MAVLVTGSEGYVGSVLCPLLEDAGKEVVRFDTGYFEDEYLIPPNSSGKYIKKDIRLINEEDLSGIDAIIHSGAISNDPIGELNPELTNQINFNASMRSVHLPKLLGIKQFLFSSSCSVYGAAGDQKLDENSPLSPVSAYAKSKIDFENGLHLTSR